MRFQTPLLAKIRAILFFSFLIHASSGNGFPDLVRHGYLNCINCHTSPSGGGTINDYGRTFSGEGLSTWTKTDEESIFHGLIKREKIPKWLSIGGDVRAVQLYVDNPRQTLAQSIMMQADFEAAVRLKKFTIDLSIGRMQTSQAKPPKPGSRRFFVMYNFTDEVMVRAGRFTPVFGINLPDHIINTRQYTGLGQGLETYNVEASWITDTWNLIGTAIQGPADTDTAKQETGGSAQLAYGFKDTHKVGASYLGVRSETQIRQLGGVHALLGFTEHLYNLAEFDWHWATQINSSQTTQSFFVYDRIGYEIHRGIHLLATVEFWKTDVTQPRSENNRYGIGTQLFPRPHFDIQALWTRWRTLSSGEYYQDYAWAVFHYYF